MGRKGKCNGDWKNEKKMKGRREEEKRRGREEKPKKRRGEGMEDGGSERREGKCRRRGKHDETGSARNTLQPPSPHPHTAQVEKLQSSNRSNIQHNTI